MTLHEAIVQVLNENDRPMKAADIACEINNQQLYQRKDGGPIPSSQIGARVINYSHVFYKESGYIGLVQWQIRSTPDIELTQKTDKNSYSGATMTLHEAIVQVLRENNRPMTAKDISREVNNQNLFQRGEGGPVPPSQIHARVNKRPQLFFKRKAFLRSDLIGLNQWQDNPAVVSDPEPSPSPRSELPITGESLDFTGAVTSISFLHDNGFKLIGIIGDVFGNGLPKLPELDACGLYAITVPNDYSAAFIEPVEAQEAGNVIRSWDVGRLEGKWVLGADIVYFGIAGARSYRPLRKRLRDLIRHGQGKTSDRGPHKGGEFLWQLEGYESFSIWVLPTSGPPSPRDLEHQLLKKFYAEAGRLPFANRKF